ncbi:hypothetical protein F4821DRAFT_126520 [Hypoxylon rubiginosum]|uniref:Uncharacterized protein n=1 Tax=Hypoxylon rubiginosum TaxID=110542 RepID=A0ACC0D1J4_9PEZI|nr:hypothetical protein F4821DRAFT_126520 [Hypoxylon rubiginosum]
MDDRIIYYDGNQLRSYKDILRQIADVYMRQYDQDEEADEDEDEAIMLINHQESYLRPSSTSAHAKENRQWITLTQLDILEKLVDDYIGFDDVEVEDYEKDGIEARGAEPSDAEMESILADIQELRKLFHAEYRFPQFRNLPPEIRIMIWEYATPPRIIYLKKMSTPPVTAMVCRESRAVARCHGRLVPMFEEGDHLLIPNGLDDDISQFEDARHRWPGQWRWFDPSRDSLYLGFNFDVCLGPSKVTSGSTRHSVLYVSQAITQQTRHVTVQCDTRYMKWAYLDLLSNPRFFPNLKTIDFVAWSFRPIMHKDHILQTRLFGYGPRPCEVIVSIDIDEGDALKNKLEADCSSRLCDTLKADLSNAKGVRWAMSPTGRMAWGQTADEKIWPNFQTELVNFWLTSQYNWHPLGGGGSDVVLKRIDGKEQPGLSVEWFRQMAPRCPTFRRVLECRLLPWDTSVDE